MDKLYRFPRAFQHWYQACSSKALFSRVVPGPRDPAMIVLTANGLAATEMRSALLGKLSLLGAVLGLVLASVSGAQALALDFSVSRGAETVDGTSLGAFTGTSTEFDFTGLQWLGSAETTAFLNDLAEPGTLNSPVTLNDPPLDPPPFTMTLPVGGAFYVQNSSSGGASGSTQVAPLFFTEMVQTSAITLTPSGSTTKFTGGNTGTVAGGGTYSLTISGVLFGSDYTTPNEASMSVALRLNNVDASLYGGTTLLISQKSTGVWSVPEPKSWVVLLVVGLGMVLLKFGRRRWAWLA